MNGLFIALIAAGVVVTALWRTPLTALVGFAPAFALLLAIYLAIPLNDLSRKFENDGRDRDLRIVSNTDKITIYPDSKICEKWEITLPAQFYYKENYYRNGRYYRWWNLDQLLAPNFLQRLRLAEHIAPLPDGYSVRGRYINEPWQKCSPEPNAHNIFVIGRLAKLPDKYGHRLWVRVRQGKKFLTVAVDRHLSQQEAGAYYKGRFLWNPLDSVVGSDIQRLAWALDDRLVPMSSLITRDYLKYTLGPRPPFSPLKTVPPIMVGRSN
jgi:hypothetical protein